MDDEAGKQKDKFRPFYGINITIAGRNAFFLLLLARTAIGSSK